MPALVSGLIHLLQRLLGASITALGVVAVVAGLLSYADPANAGVPAAPASSGVTSEVSQPPAVQTPPPSAEPTDLMSGAPSTGVATRIVIPALRIDLPVVQGPAGYPYCNVAMYYADPVFGQPGQGKPVYIFAHARDGMFGPIYNLTIVRGTPDKMVDDLVQVYTSDNKLYQYVITHVYPHQTSLDRPFAAKAEELWLQTSEGHGIPPKTQVLAVPLSEGQADPADAHPTPRPVACD